MHPRFAGANFDRNRPLAATVQALAAEKGCTAGQVALAWVLAQGPDIVPIPGTTRIRHLEEDAGALAVTLSAAERARLAAAFPPGAATGERYAPSR